MFLRELANPRFYASLFDRRPPAPVLQPHVEPPDFEETRPCPWHMTATIDIALPLRASEDPARNSLRKKP